MSEQDSRFPKNKSSGNGRIGNGSADWAYEFLEKLLEKSADGVSAVFDPEVVEQLASRKKEDPVGFESLRALLKRNGCRVAVLDEAITEISGENERSPNQTGLLISLVDDIELFHTADKTAYADIQVNGHRETWSIKSEGFSHWISQRFFEKTRNVPNSDTLRTAITNIEGRARYEGNEQNVFLRVGSLNGKMYLDLCDKDWRAIEVDADGWRVVDNPPIRFRRAPGMQPLPIPIRGGSINTLKSFLNTGSDADFVLAVSWILAAMRSRGPYPILVLSGEQGSAKSTFSDIMRAIVDPSFAPTRSLPRKDSDLFITAANTHVLAFDNISALPNSTSDMLCRLSTGAAHATRELFSDQKEVLFAATRPIIMNGIEEFVNRPDLADRSLFLTLDAIPDGKRRAEEALWQALEAELPGILGVLLNAMVEGINRISEVQPPNLPRMADFALWASACETTFWEEHTFWKAYSDNRDEVIENIVESDPVANALRVFIGRQPQNEWKGTASELLLILTNVVGGRVSKSKGWAVSANALSGRLRRAATFLRSLGVEIEFSRAGRRHRKRIIHIRTNRDFFRGISNEISAVTSSTSSTPALKSPYSTAHVDDVDDVDDLIRHPGSERKSLPPIIECDQNGNMASLTDYEGSTALSTHPFAIEPRKLYLGDNLLLLRAMASNSVDLIAGDPPFNTGREQKGFSDKSFPDKWEWQKHVRQEWIDEISKVEGLSDYIFYVKRKDPSAAAYLCFMAVRLIQMKRILKPTGSIYIHCDPHASHYLKQLMDIIFGRKNFIDEIVWNRVVSQQKGNQYESRSFGHNCDYILHYAKTSKYTHNEAVIPLTHDEIVKKFPLVENDGRRYNTTGQLFLPPGMRHRPNLCYTYKGVANPHPSCWRISLENLKEMDERGEIIWREGKKPLRKMYADEYKGKPIGCLWTDIPNVTGEKLGYPTQKPVALYERIIKASSNEGDLVLDPFCGSGTTLIAAEQLERQWIGMDESEDACKTAQKRFEDISASPAGNRQSLTPVAKNLPSIIPYSSWAENADSGNIQARTLYLGDNLLLLRAMASNSVDLITTDPPFNSGRERVGKHGESFPDDWNWQRDVRQEWIEEISKVEGLSDYIFYVKRKDPSSAAYLCFMAVRLIEMKRILKPTGSIYIHCDKNASHHLRVVMDAIFGKENFRNEIVWHYQAGTKGSNNFGNKHDVILFYTKGNTWTFNRQNKPVVNPERYKHMDENGDYYDVNGEGRRYYLKDGATCDDVWTWVQEKEFQQINSQSNERMGYPTQKPVSLLYRIIKASSNNGDLVLDPFCGSGTTLIAAEKLGRGWIGMDESEDACKTAQKRFEDISASPAGNGQSLAPIAKELPPIIPYSSWVQNSDSGSIQARTLYLGDNLLFLRAMASGSVDVIATDPPFNTGKEWVGKYGEKFPDKWEWRNDVEGVWLAEIEKEHEKLGKVIRSAIDTHSEGMGAYICFMAMRLLEMKRILKPTGSIYLHCDSIALHYLKQLMDAIFGHRNFRNQITWKRSSGKNQSNIGQFGRTSDYILFYSESPINTDAVKHKLDEAYIANNYRNYDERYGMWSSVNLTGPGTSTGQSGQPYKNYDPSKIGRAWAVPKISNYAIWLNERIPGYMDEDDPIKRLEMLDRHNMIYWSKNGVPRLKQFQLVDWGQVPNDIWTDISAVSFHSKEHTGYPTQKPIALYKRLVLASSKEGDLVLDPFCGSGTTLIAAEQLGRHWIGMDESEDACKTAQKRFANLNEADMRSPDSSGEGDLPTPETDNVPKDEEIGGSGRWNWFGKLLRGNSPGDQGG